MLFALYTFIGGKRIPFAFPQTITLYAEWECSWTYPTLLAPLRTSTFLAPVSSVVLVAYKHLFITNKFENMFYFIKNPQYVLASNRSTNTLTIRWQSNVMLFLAISFSVKSSPDLLLNQSGMFLPCFVTYFCTIPLVFCYVVDELRYLGLLLLNKDGSGDLHGPSSTQIAYSEGFS